MPIVSGPLDAICICIHRIECLSKITNKIFRPEDDPILEYLDDDGMKIEPKFFIPVICMSLVNGSSGIGTGFSTNIMPHNPLDIISNIRTMNRVTQVTIGNKDA